MTDPKQVAINPETLAQKQAAEIRERITEIDNQLEAIDAEIAQLNSVMLGNWRQTAQNPLETERAAEDLERVHRRRNLMRQIKDKAAQDLEAAERQITLDRFAETRAKFDALMQQRTNRAHDVVATVEMLAAAVEEIHEIGRQAIQLFSLDAAAAGVSFNEAIRTINKVHPQGHIDLLLASRLDRGLWDSTTGARPAPHFKSEFPKQVDAERTALLAEFGGAVLRTTTANAA